MRPILRNKELATPAEPYTDDFGDGGTTFIRLEGHGGISTETI